MDPMLCDVFDIKFNGLNRSVLKFSDDFCSPKMLREPLYHNPYRKDWACMPRNRPLAFVEAIHDLPRLKKTGRSLNLSRFILANQNVSPCLSHVFLSVLNLLLYAKQI